MDTPHPELLANLQAIVLLDTPVASIPERATHDNVYKSGVTFDPERALAYESSASALMPGRDGSLEVRASNEHGEFSVKATLVRIAESPRPDATADADPQPTPTDDPPPRKPIRIDLDIRVPSPEPTPSSSPWLVNAVVRRCDEILTVTVFFRRAVDHPSTAPQALTLAEPGTTTIASRLTIETYEPALCH